VYRNIYYTRIAYVSSFYLASLLHISLQPRGFNQNTVGKTQDVICSISLSSDVDPDSIELSWLKKEDFITADGRVTIINGDNNSNASNLIISTIIHFEPLTEEDEGNYICYAKVNGSFVFKSIQLQNFRSKYHTHSILFILAHVDEQVNIL